VKLHYILAVASFFAFVPSAKADPSPGIQWLMNEPATLFDWGMLSLYEGAKALPKFMEQRALTERRDYIVALKPIYDFEKNEIIIPFSLMHVEPEYLTHKNCIEATRKIKKWFFVSSGISTWRYDAQDEERIAGQVMSSYFSHWDFVQRDRPTDLGAELARNTVFRVTYLRRLRNEEDELERAPPASLKCGMPLGGGPVSVIEGGVMVSQLLELLGLDRLAKSVWPQLFTPDQTSPVEGVKGRIPPPGPVRGPVDNPP